MLITVCCFTIVLLIRENVSAAPSYKYPTDNPALKHDILCSTSIIDIINGKPTNNAIIPLETIDELTFAIEQSAIAPSELPRDVVRLSTIYTYPDAPTKPKPLSAALRVWRLARQALFNRATTNDTNSILGVCTIAVKLPVHISQKDIRAQDKTKRFRNFVEYLHTNELVAVLACDSAGRVGFIVTSGSTTGTEGRYSALLYYAQAKEFLPLARQNNKNNNGFVDAPSDGEIKPRGSSGFPFPRTHFGGRGSRRGYSALEQDEQARGYNGQGGRGSSRGFNNGNGDRGIGNFGGDSGSSWRGGNNERYGGVNRGRGDDCHDRGRSDLGMYGRNGKCTNQILD